MNEIQYEIFRLYGIVTDIEPVEMMNGTRVPGVPTPAVWSGGSNVYFDDGATKRVNGWSPFAAPMPVGADPIFQLNVLSPITSWWLWVDAQTPTAPKVYVTDGVNHFDITPAAGLTGGGVGDWTGTVLNGVPVLNNGYDAPIWWDGQTANPMETLPDWPANTLCKAIRAFKYHLIAMNLTENSVVQEMKYMWSAAADPGTIPSSWTVEPGNDAGFNTLSATQGGIVDGGKLRDNFIIYKQHSCYIISYIAGQYVFAVRSLFVTVGCQALNCIQEMKGYHYVFADDDVIQHDGNTYRSIIDRKNRKLLFGNINPDNHWMSHMAARLARDEIWLIAPGINNTRNTVALTYSYSEDQWGARSLDNVAYICAGIVPEGTDDPTWDGATETWQEKLGVWNQASYSATNDRLLGSGGGYLQSIDASNTDNGAPIYSHVERLNWTIHGEPHIWQNDLVRSIYPVITGTDGDQVKIEAACTKTTNENPAWQEQVLVIGGSEKVDLFTTGRYFNIRISTINGNPWQLHRIGIEFIPKAKF